jgi:hypothetical protein
MYYFLRFHILSVTVGWGDAGDVSQEITKGDQTKEKRWEESGNNLGKGIYLEHFVSLA